MYVLAARTGRPLKELSQLIKVGGMQLSEDDLKPFDWDEYKAGDGSYYVSGLIMHDTLSKIEDRSGRVYFIDTYTKYYKASSLRLLKCN
jgi:hypothetical protein